MLNHIALMGRLTRDPELRHTQSGTAVAGFTLAVEREFVFRIGDSPKGLCVGADGETVYFLNEDVWRMAADAEELPAQPYIRAHETIYYALGVDPHSGDLYLGDAIDYQQQGVVYRFSAEGVPLDTLRVGITPTAFCFR